jgi:methylated-DNA-[protein]-cysteine S-methyltransferase
MTFPAETLRIATPFGRDLVLAADNETIVASTFRARRGERRARGKSALLKEAARQLQAYFARRLRRFDLPLRLEGTLLQVATWKLVTQLSFGEVVTYGDVARALGHPLAHRGVAAAMRRSPYDLLVPAHRVIGADGRVKGAGPKSIRRRLLEFERPTVL